MSVSDTTNANRLRAILQSPLNKGNQSVNKILLGVAQIKYQGGLVSAFSLHPTILSSYIIVAAIYGFACICCTQQILPSSIQDCYLPVLETTVNLAGSLATTLLLMAIVPNFGWVVCLNWIMLCVKMTWSVHAQIYTLLRLAFDNVVSLLTSFFPTNCVLPN